MNTFLICFLRNASAKIARAAKIDTVAIEILTFKLKIRVLVSASIFIFSFFVNPKTLSELQLSAEQQFFARSGLSLCAVQAIFENGSFLIFGSEILEHVTFYA